MASASRALNEMGAYVEELEAQRDQLKKDMDRLLAAAWKTLEFPADIQARAELRFMAQELEAGRGGSDA